MMRTVFCRKLKQELEGMAFAPFPGERGQVLFDTVSKEAWMQWLRHQTMLINENRLSVLDPQAKAFLDEQLEKFLSGDDYERPQGWTPEKSS
ncbi:Fe-S cluster biosynthesis and repair protein YggX [Paraperlucidibaca baekdonensis]|uniref:Probable Fe(2+)-trafficking protein n=1 Tax=Paraperlucidibaca baekdonensis TaxID=748120 RepID=A0A3E0H8V4_9GAMM|nr:oxidative damage protection protein [Paraperlucidibaca baekdonensis]REH40064.1 Fe-S cluster biosynthesis and repair protein YggX [Paraperlucidibaca baekdonensis]